MTAKAVADALAARFTGVTATVNGVAESLTMSTASLPNIVGKGPALLVYHPSGDLSLGLSKRREDVLDFPVRLLRDPVNYPARSDALYAWFDAIRDRIEMDMDLGLAYVAWAKPVAVRIELDGEDYAGVTYDVVELTVQVRFNEIVSSASV